MSRVNGKYLDPYRFADEYERIRPRYLWARDKTEIHLAACLLNELLSHRKRRFRLTVELGCGACRFTQLLSTFSEHVIATDPSESMTSHCRRLLALNDSCEVLTESAEEVVASGLVRCADLVAAFWSLTYPLQSFFGLTLAKNGRILQQVENDEALARMWAFLDGLFDRAADRDYLFFLFSSESIEQTWVTEQWLKMGPLPGGSREATWRALEHYLLTLHGEGHEVKSEIVQGVMLCRDEAALAEVFLRHHLRGLIPPNTTEQQLRANLMSAMRAFQSPVGSFRIPAAFRLVRVHISGRKEAKSPSGSQQNKVAKLDQRHPSC